LIDASLFLFRICLPVMPKEEITGWKISERTDPQDLEKQLDDLSYMQQWGFTGTRCDTCGKSNSELGGTLIQCGKCNQVQYCNWACLKKNEAKHLPECEKIYNARRRQRQQQAAAIATNQNNGKPTPSSAKLSETTIKSKGTDSSPKALAHDQGAGGRATATSLYSLKKPSEHSSSARTTTGSTKKNNTEQPPLPPSRLSETLAGDARHKNNPMSKNTTSKQHLLPVHPLDSVVEQNKTHSNNAKPPGRRPVEPKDDGQCTIQSSSLSTRTTTKSRSTGTIKASSSTTGQATNTIPGPMQQQNSDTQQERMSKRLDTGSRPTFQPPTGKKTSAVAAVEKGKDVGQAENVPVTHGVVQSATAVGSSSSIHPQQQPSTLDTAVRPQVNGIHNNNKNTPETIPISSNHEPRRTAKKTGSPALRSLSTPPVDRSTGARTEQLRTFLPNRPAVGSNASPTYARNIEKVGHGGEGLVKPKKNATVLANRKWPPQTSDDERDYVIHHSSDLAKSAFSSSRNWTPKKAATPKLNATTASPKTPVQTSAKREDLSKSAEEESQQPANLTRQKKEQPQTVLEKKSLSGPSHMEPPGHVLKSAEESHNLTLAKSASISTTGSAVSQEQNHVGGQKEPPGYLLEQVDPTAAPAKPPLVVPVNHKSLKTTEAQVSTEQANVVDQSPKQQMPEQLSNGNGRKENVGQNSKDESELGSDSQPGTALSDSEEIPSWMQKTPVQTVVRVDSKEPPLKTSISAKQVESTPVSHDSENSGMTSDSTCSSGTVNPLKGTTPDWNTVGPLVEVAQEEPPAFNPYRSYKAPMKKDDEYTVSRNNSLNGRRRPRRNKSYS